MYMYIYIYVYTRVCIYIYIYIYISSTEMVCKLSLSCFLDRLNQTNLLIKT